MSSENSMIDHAKNLTTKYACEVDINEYTAMLLLQGKNTPLA